MNKFDSREQEQFMSQRIPDKMRILLLSKHNCCEKCGSTIGLEIHHKKPLSLGGNTVEENLIVLCANCHIEAHIMDRSELTKLGIEKARKTPYEAFVSMIDIYKGIQELCDAGIAPTVDDILDIMECKDTRKIYKKLKVV